MTFKTFIKETKELLRDGRIRIAFLLVIAILGVAVWISARQYAHVNEQYAVAKTAERAIWDNQGAKNPHSAAHYGTYAFKPKYPLSLVDQGVDKYTGTSIFLEAHNRNEAAFSAAADQTGLARFGDLTPDFILLFIIPLLIILLGYNSFTKEREMGTMTLLKSQGISNWKWMMGKWMALFLPVFLITTFLFLIAGSILSNLDDFGVFDSGSLLMMFLVYMGYFMVFMNLVLLISAWTKSSGISLVASLCIWIIACLAAPKAASNIAETKHPFPTRQEFAANVLQDKKEGLDGHNPWSEEARRLEKEVLEQYGVDSLHQLPFNFDGYRMQKGEEHQAAVYFKHYNYLKEQYANQSRIYRSLAIISPYLPTRFMSMALAHTDYATHWHFADAAEEYRIATQKFLNDHFAENSSYGDWSYLADPEVWKQLPAFEYDPPELASILSGNLSNLGILGIWLVVTFGLLSISLKKI
ncbi:ABC transporter permease [Robiginitalea sp.]|uniref:ABC transporter permease n=1 Tax=Robiginitalea sp. TaxID=1902411 RepID=UPI003C750770